MGFFKNINKDEYIHVKYMAMDQYPLIPFLVGMIIHLPAILMFTRGTRFWHTAICQIYVWSDFSKAIRLFHTSDESWLTVQLCLGTNQGAGSSDWTEHPRNVMPCVKRCWALFFISFTFFYLGKKEKNSNIGGLPRSMRQKPHVLPLGGNYIVCRMG